MLDVNSHYELTSSNLKQDCKKIIKIRNHDNTKKKITFSMCRLKL